MRLRAIGRDLSLLLFGAVGAFVVGTWLSAQVALALAGAMGDSSPVLRVVAGALALDLTKAPGLLGAAWLLGRAIRLRPAVAAGVLILLTYGAELAIAALLGQLSWLWVTPAVLLCRCAAALLLFWLVGLQLRRRAAAGRDAAEDDTGADGAGSDAADTHAGDEVE